MPEETNGLCDGLLEQALNAERFSGAQSTEVVAYAPNRVADLSTEREHLRRPVVYHLLGRVSASPKPTNSHRAPSRRA